MKTIRDIEQLLQEGRVDEAYKELKEFNETNKDEVSFLYLTLLDLDINYQKISNDEFISRFEKLIKSKNPKIRRKTYEPYLSLLLDIEDYARIYNVSIQAKKEGLDSYIVNLAYAKSSIEYKDIKTKEIEELLISNINNAPSEQAKTLSQTYVCEYFCRNERFEEARKFIKNLYFTHNDGYAQYLNLIISTYENPESRNIEEYQKAINTAYKYETLIFLSDFYYYANEYERTLEYLEELLVLTSNEISIQYKKAICLLELNKVEEAKQYLLSMDQNDYNVCYLLGKIPYQTRTRKGYDESKEYFFKALEIYPNEDIYKLLFRVCEETRDFKNWKKVIDHLEMTGMNNGVVYANKMAYYNNSGNFDEALKIAKELKKHKYSHMYLSNYSYCETNPNKLNKYFRKYNGFFKARAYLYGYYGMKINREKFKPFIKKYENEYGSNCIDSLIAKYYLDENDVENALKYINRGMERFNNNQDMCCCVVGYYAYCMMNGIGMEQDVQKAYDLAVKTIDDNFGVISESLGNLYAECAIILKKDLNPVYDFLIETIEKRYTLGRYFMIIKVGKLLGKDVSYYEKMYKKSFKYENKLEVQYYKNNPQTFVMNNF